MHQKKPDFVGRISSGRPPRSPTNSRASSPEPKKKAIIIGAGPQGLATGIKLLEKGFNVRILEASPDLGEGISERPDCNPWGIQHSGVYYPQDSKNTQYCTDSYRMLKRNPAEGTTLEKIYRDNTLNSGKVILARTDQGVEYLKAFKNRLDQYGVITNHLLQTPEEIEALNESDMGTPKAVLHLPDVNCINIKGLLGQLQQSFVQKGGKIITDAKAYSLIANKDTQSLSVFCKDENYTGDVIVNLAGLGGQALANNAKDVAETKLGVADVPPPPEMQYAQYLVVKRKKNAEQQDQPWFKNVVYAIENGMNDDGSLSGSVGIHSYLSDTKVNGKFSATFGPFSQDKTLDEIKALTAEDWQKSHEITPKMIEQIKNVYPAFNPQEYEANLVGKIAKTPGPDRQFEMQSYQAGRTLMIHSFTSDSPGLTACLGVAKDITDTVQSAFAQELRQARGVRSSSIGGEADLALKCNHQRSNSYGGSPRFYG